MIRVLFRNLGYKLLSLLIAIVLWFAVLGGERRTTISLNVPVECRNIPANLEISSDLPDRIYVEIEGPSARLREGDTGRTVAILDLSGVDTPGERTFNIGPDNVRLAPGMRVLRAIPAQVRLRFERPARREVPVTVRFASPPPQGYQVAGTEVIPPKLVLLGPESRVNHVLTAETDSINLAGWTRTTEFRVNAFVGDPLVRFESSPEVVVRVSIERAAAKDASASGQTPVRN